MQRLLLVLDHRVHPDRGPVPEDDPGHDDYDDQVTEAWEHLHGQPVRVLTTCAACGKPTDYCNSHDLCVACATYMSSVFTSNVWSRR